MKKPVLVGVATAGLLFLVAPPRARADEKPAAAVKASTQVVSVTAKSSAAVEAFLKGREHLDNLRTAEAVEQFTKAIELDPGFALAHAYLGTTTPGPEGVQHLEQAASLSKGLPEAERMEIEIFQSINRGDEEKARELRARLATMASEDWRPQFLLGAQLSGERKWDEAIAALTKAATLNPKAGAVYNTMGYTYLNMGKSDQAAEAFQKYVAINPDEPNPQDSLGEALLAAGRYDEAEAAFRKAGEISPRFWTAHEGIAQTRFLRGDWAGGRAALAMARAAAPRSIDRLFMDEELALSHAAEGDMEAALKAIDAMEKAAVAEKSDTMLAFAAIDRALVLQDLGKGDEALKQAAMAIERAQKAGVPGGVMNSVRRAALAVRIDAESKLGRVADTKKTLALVEDEARKAPANAGVRSMLHFARGTEAASRGDFKAAATHFRECSDQDYYCRWQHVVALEKSGDKSGAEAARRQLTNANRRDPLYLYVRSKLVAKGAAPR